MSLSLSERKEIGDRYQLEGPDLTHYLFDFFLLFEKKNKLDQSRGEGIHPTDSTTITM